MFKKKLGWNRTAVILCMLPPIILHLCCVLYPSFVTLIYSFTDATRGAKVINWLGMENYTSILFHQNFRDLYTDSFRTVLFAFVTTVTQNIVGVLFAVLFNSKVLKGRNFYRSVIFLPYVLGSSVICYTWVLLMGIDGPILAACKTLGIDTALLGGQKDAFKCVMFISVWSCVGYTMVLDIAGLQGIPNELYESATMDGANEVQSFFKITVPLLWETLSINILLCIVGSLGAINVILLTTSGYQATETLGLKIYKEAFGVGGNSTARVQVTQGYAAAESILLFLLTLTFAVLTRKLSRKVESRYE